MKKIFLFLFFTINYNIYSQGIGHYNQYPTLHVDTYLDQLDNTISFAYSMRRLYSNYTGPIIKLRRKSDNITKVFYAIDTDLVDINAITTWAAGSNLYVDTWYDQSGLNRNAIQTTITKQPQFYIDSVLPYFQGDGVDDFLVVSNSHLHDLTTNGKDGTVLLVAKATDRNQNSFGISNGNYRWLSHLNWGNERAYFDAGFYNTSVATNQRSFYNLSGINVFKQYSLISGSPNTIIMRQNTVEQLNTTTSSNNCNYNFSFFISAASTSTSTNPDTATGNMYATTGFNEFILYKTKIPENTYKTVEQIQMAFWGL
ncbi:arabinofuranosidase catalytic domain-containing protein [Tenacibaculum sp. UWU-22]|uniref:arabinofuranosidase catalytic domain-containing protein n=1 Tax=Tenacibaculum sp. UWU-22 TaxID=3234187 RepID=UPI0034DB7085